MLWKANMDVVGTSPDGSRLVLNGNTQEMGAMAYYKGHWQMMMKFAEDSPNDPFRFVDLAPDDADAPPSGSPKELLKSCTLVALMPYSLDWLTTPLPLVGLSHS